MSMTIRSILLAYDGSEMSKRAAAVAGELAQRLEAQVQAVHVLELPRPIVTVEAAITTTPELAEEFRAAATDLLKQAGSLLPPACLTAETLLEGSPGPSLVGYAAKIGCDLIVVGHRGRNGLERFFLGSVSEYILRHAHCPVLVVKD